MAARVAAAADKPIRVLFVGGDWKARLAGLSRGKNRCVASSFATRFKRRRPGQFDFTLWTSYEFLQYGEPASLGKFDVIVAGDVMGQSVLPRLAR